MASDSNALSSEDLQASRGFRDFMTSEKLLRDNVLAVIKRTAERYGFTPLETPALEKWEVLSAKYAGGEEILKETYKLEDQGGRKLALRYDLTVPLARVIASNPRLAMPFKRYAFAPVWRDGPLKTGRYREFWQCDVDVVGAPGQLVEAELLALAANVFDELGLNAVLTVNNRKILDGMLETAGVPSEKWIPAILSIDKLAKIGRAEVKKELISVRGLSEEAASRVMELLAEVEEVNGNEKRLSALKKKMKSSIGAEGLTEMETLFRNAKAFGVESRVRFEPWLARGLSYYTGFVFEASLPKSKITSSVCAGGRYDDMIGKFAGRAEKIPAVGISFGLDVICESLKLGDSSKKEFQNAAQASVARVLVIALKPEQTTNAIQTVQALRESGVNALVDPLQRSVGKNLEWAGKQGIPYAIIIGPKEAEQEKVTLRDLQSGKEELTDVKSAAKKLAR